MKPQILRGLRFLFSLVVAAVSPLLFSRVACGPTGVSGAGGPGRCVCRWAAARPSDGVACGATGVPGAAWGRAALWGPAAVCAGGRRPAREIATRELRSEWSISRSALALPPPTGTAARPRHRPSISHVFPLRLVQTLNLRRWNCNVFEVSRKMTTINYVRNLGGGSVVAARGHHSQAPCLEAFPVLSFACNSLTPAVRHLAKSLEFQRLHFKA